MACIRLLRGTGQEKDALRHPDRVLRQLSILVSFARQRSEAIAIVASRVMAFQDLGIVREDWLKL